MRDLNKPLKVVFFGTPQFAAELLECLLAQDLEIVGIVTKPDRPQGRSDKLIASEVKKTALRLAIEAPILQPSHASADDFYEELISLDADLYVVVAYGEIIKQRVLDLPTYGCINVHASLLPKFRGAAPIQRSIIEGETESGVTIMQMVRKMDAGDIIKTAKVPIHLETTYGQLEHDLCQAAKSPLVEVIKEYAKGFIPSHISQDIEKVTFAPKIETSECQIDWYRPALSIHNFVRGVNPHPGAWCLVEFKGEIKRIKICRTKPLPHISGEAGVILESKPGHLYIGCKVGALSILEVQLEGKRKMSIEEFLRGVEPSHLRFNL